MIKSLPSQFNIRVYGIFTNEAGDILITDEYQLDTKMTKFPGGGLHFGEGTIDCLKREMREECNQHIENIQHFYTTDYFQKSLYFEKHQLISIYYTAKLKMPINFRTSSRAFDFEKLQNGRQSFRWIPVEKLDPNEFTFPIDKHVVALIKKSINKINCE